MTAYRTILLKIVLSAYFVLTGISCKKPVYEEFPEFEQIPVVNSILVSDSMIKVHVSLAENLDTSYLSGLENAEVNLFMNGQFEERLTHTHDGIYTGETIMSAGNVYTCEVGIPGYPLVTATDSIPFPNEILWIDQKVIAGYNEEGTPYSSVTFAFKQRLGIKDYYEVLLYAEKEFKYPVYVFDELLLNEGGPLSVFSDELMKDSIYSMTLNYYRNTSYGRDDCDLCSRDEVCIELRTVSYDYYQFTKQLYFYEKGRYPEFYAGSYSVTNLHSNIENGLGIFASYSKVLRDTIELQTSY